MKVKSESEVRSVVSDSSRPYGMQPTRLLHPWDFPGKSTGVGCHPLLREKSEVMLNEWGFKKGHLMDLIFPGSGKIYKEFLEK